MMELLFMNIGPTSILLITLPVALFVFYSLFHAATNMAIPVVNRLTWGLLILAAPLLGGIGYWVMGWKLADRSKGK